MILPEDITLAFLLNDLHNEYSRSVCRGALSAARELKISIVFFGVGSIDSPILYTAKRNKLFSFINPDDFQGMLYVSSSISNFVGTENFLKYSERYGNIPSAHIGIEAPGQFSFNIDNESGMYDVVAHMIEVHGRRKIAFISGTRGVQEADDRLAAYKRALESHNIPFDDRYVYYGNFLREEGFAAVQDFLDNRKIDMDALVGANDHMALYAMKELQKRGYRIPEDICIGGFDDLASAKSHKPALTTVHQPADLLGYTAVADFAQWLMTGEGIPRDIRLPAQMKVRQSCGCPVSQEKEPSENSGYKLISEMTSAERDEFDSTLNTMTRNIIGTFEESEIRTVLDESLNIFDIEEFSLAKYVNSHNSAVFYSTRGKLNRHFPSRRLTVDGLESLKRPFCKFVLPLFYRNEDIGFFISDIGSKDFSVLEVMRDHLSGAMKGARLLEDAKHYAESLEKKVEERTRELAVALDNVKRASEKLERLSVMDELTGLYNRRGFLAVAGRQVELTKRNKDILIVFLDLDGLKHINDNFGHAVGDIAIKAMADILVKTFRQTDIIARYGGDEFTVLAIDCTISEYDKIIKRAENLAEEYNRTSGQNFHLSFSSGAAPSVTGNYVTLEELMEEADEELYKVKKRKKI